ncbi:MAG: xanthine dehydrogenase family protein [Rhodobiaceae bacterium]|nr:xanthine dehydrogenase family protein [Rhodobiaceae bacterium]
MHQASRPTQFGIGASLRRHEDPALISGKGRFVADLVPEGALHAFVLRSAVAHGRFTLHGLAAARAADGVADIITGADVTRLGTLPCLGMLDNADGSTPYVPPYPVLPLDRVRHVGEALAMVVGQSRAAAQAAAELIEPRFEELPCVVDGAAALAEGAPLLWEQLGSNLAFDAEHGDREATDAAFAGAHKVVRLELVNNRLVANFLEPRGALGVYDPESGRYHLTAGSQGVHLLVPALADHVLKIPRERLHVVTPDVGGGFGTKYFTYREYALVLLAAERTGRPVAWIADRVEHFLADYHGRDHVSRAELALDEEGRFLAVRADTVANMGAYLGQMAVFVGIAGGGMVPGVYRTPAVHVRMRGAYTNTVPVDAYRGAGRPEAAYLIERLVDKAAREIGMAPDEIRRRNMIGSGEIPFTTPTGRTYDSGDFAGHMARAMERADWAGFAAREKVSLANGRLRGIGMATYIEACSGGGPEEARVDLMPDGTATIRIGTQSSGQGHHTAYAQLAGAQLGISPDRIKVIQGDSDEIARGAGTGGSRSIPVGGTGVFRAAGVLAEKLRERAGESLEAAPDDIELGANMARIKGTDRAVAIGALIAAMDEGERQESRAWQPPAPTYPNGTHIAEVEIDPETGAILIHSYTVVDDFGVALNPLLLEGQIHGGVAQGIGQAMLERTVYDGESGQLVTASLMDYCLPRADDVPMFDFEMRNMPSATNALGMKGAGEAGAIGACPALVNAVCDALARAGGASHIDMPMTPESVWKALRGGDEK